MVRGWTDRYHSTLFRVEIIFGSLASVRRSFRGVSFARVSSCGRGIATLINPVHKPCGLERVLAMAGCESCELMSKLVKKEWPIPSAAHQHTARATLLLHCLSLSNSYNSIPTLVKELWLLEAGWKSHGPRESDGAKTPPAHSSIAIFVVGHILSFGPLTSIPFEQHCAVVPF